jgi:hypothetical protein
MLMQRDGDVTSSPIMRVDVDHSNLESCMFSLGKMGDLMGRWINWTCFICSFLSRSWILIVQLLSTNVRSRVVGHTWYTCGGVGHVIYMISSRQLLFDIIDENCGIWLTNM